MTSATSVLGPVPASALGRTLMHEHLVWDFSTCHVAPRDAREAALADGPVRPEALGALRFNPCLSLDNLVHDDVQLTMDELQPAIDAGVATVVDPTNRSIGRDPDALQAIARATGLNVIMGCGYYYQIALDAAFERRAVQDVADEIERDLLDGVGDTGCRAGLIGEIGTSAPITPAERISLRGAARAQRATGAPLMIHLDGWGREGHRALDLVAEEGADLTRTILCHMNPSWDDVEYQTGLLDRGATLEFDMFGIDHFYPPDRASPSELPVLEAVARLLARGDRDRLLLSQDVYLKMMFVRHGGYGYGHLLTTLRPYLTLAGIGDADLQGMLIDNPRRLLAFA